MTIARGRSSGFFVGVVAIDDVARYELVQQPGHGLDPDEASNKARHHEQASALVRPARPFQVFI